MAAMDLQESSSGVSRRDLCESEYRSLLARPPPLDRKVGLFHFETPGAVRKIRSSRAGLARAVKADVKHDSCFVVADEGNRSRHKRMNIADERSAGLRPSRFIDLVARAIICSFGRYNCRWFRFAGNHRGSNEGPLRQTLSQEIRGAKPAFELYFLPLRFPCGS